MDPMDIDPIDGGPKQVQTPPLSVIAPSSSHAVIPVSSSTSSSSHVTKEEEARQAIDMLRGEDLAGRIAAANRLEGVAFVLGPQRTREVCWLFVVSEA